MKILLVEPFLTGSHASWAEQFAARSSHQVEILSLPGRHWKWRMHGGAVTLARRFMSSGYRPDLILATDMLDLTTFLALTRQCTSAIPAVVYFHENQITYPWSPADADPAEKRDAHYSFINYATAMAADRVIFNSDYHRRSFFDALDPFLQSFPDQNERDTVGEIARKSAVLPLGMDLKSLDAHRSTQDRKNREPPLVLWNHRWEFDKNPDEFFGAMIRLADEGVPFRLAVVGETFSRRPRIFDLARERLGDRVVVWGFLHIFAEYAELLWRADLLPVTSIHDFFGASVVQAIYCGCAPLLPDRLAYPEHIPADCHETFLYREGELLPKLRQMLLKPPSPPSLAALRDSVARYDWESMAPTYDGLLEHHHASTVDARTSERDRPRNCRPPD